MRDIRPSSQKRRVRRLAPPPETEPVLPLEPKPRFSGSAVPVNSITVPMPEKPRNEKPAPKPKKPRAHSPHLSYRDRIIVLTLVGLALVVGLIGALIFLPTANIKIVLRTAPLLVDQKLTLASTGSGSDVIPGTAYSKDVEIQGTNPVTSTEIIGTKARGNVILVNRSFDEQKIKERSRLVTKDGQLFYMLQGVNIPAATSSSTAQITTEIEAAESGTKGNIEPQRLDFAALGKESQAMVYGETKTAFTSGSGQAIAVVKDEDIAAAKKAAGQAARTQVEQSIRGELPKGWALLDESWTADFSQFDAKVKVGDKVQEVPYTAKVTVRVMSYQIASLEQKLKDTLNSHIDEQYMLFPGAISYTKTVNDIAWDKSEAQVSVRVTHTTIPKFSLDTLKQKLVGRQRAEAQQYLEGLPGVRSVNIKFWPFWVNSIPSIEKRVSLNLEPERQP